MGKLSEDIVSAVIAADMIINLGLRARKLLVKRAKAAGVTEQELDERIKTSDASRKLLLKELGLK